MYIRRTTQKNHKTGSEYCTYRLVETYRAEKDKVRQRILLNLGKHFDVPSEQWKLLAYRIEEIISGQKSFLDTDEKLEPLAQSIANRVIHRYSDRTFSKLPQEKQLEVSKKDYCTIDLNSIEHQNIRQIGAEHVGLETARKLGLDKLLAELKFNRKQINIALGTIIGRLIAPGSERSTHNYLKTQSALDELLGCDFQKLSLDQLYNISDKLEKNKSTIESRLFEREKNLFGLSEIITLYDLTNTYFEGKASNIEKAAYGRSKEKRTDCPLVTLGLVLDSSGFPKKSKIFEGNVSEPKTLEKMLSQLEGEAKPTLVMDAGIATEENITWLQEHHYHYIVVSRKTKQTILNEDDPDIVTIRHQKEYDIKAKLKINKETNESELYCYSELKAEKERSMHNQSAIRFEEALEKLSAGLNKKGTMKGYQKVVERVGRLKERYKRVGMLYKIQIIADETNKKTIAIHWEKQLEKKKVPGIYCLRSNRMDLDEQSLWSIYITLTDLEAAFRCLKSELGLRPIYHQKTARVDSHIFISVLAYHLLHTIRFQLKAVGIHESWKTLRNELVTHCRLTSTMKSKQGKTIHLRKTSKPNPRQAEIYTALKISKIPGKTEKTVV